MINEIPSYITMEESYLFLIESAERDFNSMWSSLAINEYYEITSNNNIFNESGDSEKKGISKFIESIVNWIKARWNDITKFFEKVMNEIRKKIDEFTNKVAKSTLKWIPKKLNKLKPDKTYGKTYQFPDFDNIMTTGGELYKHVFDYSNKILNKLAKGTSNKEEFIKELQNMENSFKTSFGVGKDAKDGELKDAMKKRVYGEEVTINAEYIKKNYEKMVNDCADYTKLHRKLKNNLNGLKKAYDEDIKTAKNLAKKGENEAYSKSLSEALTAGAPFIKKTHTYITTASSVILGAVRKKVFKELLIIGRLAITFGKDQTEEKKEVPQAQAESHTYQTEMASLFNFNI